MPKLWLVARLPFMFASLALFTIGACWAVVLGAPLSLSRMLLGYLIVLPAHLSVSYSNDYFDVGVDSLGVPTAFTGGSGVLVGHPELRRPAKRIAMGLIACSMALGILFLARYSYPLWFIAYIAVCNLLGWFYSAPPLKLAYRGLGEWSTALTAGVLVPGLGYLVMTTHVARDGLLFIVPLLLYGLAFILVVEIPDLEVDRLGHKRTWVARWGRGFGFVGVGTSLVAATAFFFGLPALSSRVLPVDSHLLGALSVLPLPVAVWGMVKKPVDRDAATRLVNAMIVTMALFFVLLDAYLLHLATP